MKTSNMTRRTLFRSAATTAVGFATLQTAFHGTKLIAADEAGFGPLIPDPNGVLDLPRGFKYDMFSLTGQVMDDGFKVPGAHDGMGAFPGPDGTTVLVRNHENGTIVPGAGGSPFDGAIYGGMDKSNIYDVGTSRPASGGTTNIVYDTRRRRMVSHHLSLVGTIRNCAGGPSPWNSWLTCEETNNKAGDNSSGSILTKDHGYVFDVPASATPGLTSPVPLKALGRMSHEALAIDPATGIVYETEDRGDSCLYRFIPDVPNDLSSGKLQALKILGGAQSTNNRGADANFYAPGVAYDVEWVDLVDPESPNDDLRAQAQALGAAVFSRGEGCWWGNGAVYFACTNGGFASLGQIFKYTPSPAEGTANEDLNPGKLELFIEPSSSDQFAAPDNIAIGPNGDVIICEDGSSTEYVHGVTAAGGVYKIAANRLNSSEFAGACFSPDGSTLFVNIQSPGITYAIFGPWHRRLG